MIQKFIFFLISSIIFSLFVYGDSKFELGSLAGTDNNEQNKNELSSRRTQKKESISVQEIDQENPLSGKKPSEYAALIKNLEFLLSRSKNKEEKEKNLFNLVSVRLMLARVLLTQGKNQVQKKHAESQLNAALKDSKNLIDANKGNREKQSLAHYFTGVILIELEGSQKTILSHFNRAIDLDATNLYNPIMTIYIAEELFEHEHYQRAISYYSRFHKLMTPFQRSLADFKTAWCQINLKNFLEAERLFMSIVLDKRINTFHKDSAVNLAYVMTQHRDESTILKVVKGLQSQMQLENYIDFLETLHATILEEVSGEGGKQVIQELFSVQKDPIKKVEYLLRRVRYVTTLFASKKYYDSLMLVFQEIEKNKLNIATITPSVKESIGIELEKLIRSFVETFAGRTKTPEAFTKKSISDYLTKPFTLYVENFNHQKPYLDVVKIWLDICVDVKDHICVYKLSLLIEKDKKLASIVERGELERLVSLEELTKQDEKKYRAEFIKRLEIFARKRTDSKIWPDVTKKLVYFYLMDKNYTKSIGWLKIRYDRLHEKEDYYKLQETLYISEQYDELIKNRIAKNYEEDKRLTPFLRESVLKLANLSLQKKDIKSYEYNIKFFLSLNPEPEKALIAEKNYLSQLALLNRFDDIKSILSGFSIQKKFSTDFLPFTRNLSAHYSQNGDFVRALEVLHGSEKINPDVFFNERLLLELSTKKYLNYEDYSSLTNEQKQYVLNLYVVSFPEQAFSFLIKMKGNLTDFEKKITMLSYQLVQKNMDAIVPRQIASVLGDIVPMDRLEYPLTSTEAKLSNLQFKSFSKFDKNAEKFIESLLTHIRGSRTTLLQDLKGKPLKIQERGFRLASSMEKKCAQYLIEMPAPAALDATQIEEYNGAVKKMAQEFVDQSLLYDKSLQELSMRLIEDEKQKSKSFLQPDMNRWPWPSRKELIVPLSSAKNTFGSLLYLDFLKNEKKVTQTEYSILRTGLLLKTHADNQAMRDYLVLELKSLEQSAVISRWERIQSK